MKTEEKPTYTVEILAQAITIKLGNGKTLERSKVLWRSELAPLIGQDIEVQLVRITPKNTILPPMVLFRYTKLPDFNYYIDILWVQ